MHVTLCKNFACSGLLHVLTDQIYAQYLASNQRRTLKVASNQSRTSHVASNQSKALHAATNLSKALYSASNQRKVFNTFHPIRIKFLFLNKPTLYTDSVHVL